MEEIKGVEVMSWMNNLRVAYKLLILAVIAAIGMSCNWLVWIFGDSKGEDRYG